MLSYRWASNTGKSSRWGLLVKTRRCAIRNIPPHKLCTREARECHEKSTRNSQKRGMSFRGVPTRQMATFVCDDHLPPSIHRKRTRIFHCRTLDPSLSGQRLERTAAQVRLPLQCVPVFHKVRMTNPDPHVRVVARSRQHRRCECEARADGRSRSPSGWPV